MPVFNRHQQRNTVEQLVEEYTNLRITRRQFMQRALAVGLSTSAAVSILESCGTSGGVSGNGTPTTVKSIDSLVVISDGELDKYNEVNAAFTAKSGIKVNVESTRDLLTVLNTRIRGNNPPDIAAPTPALLNTLAGQGKLLRLDTFLDMNSIHANYSSAWTDI